MRFTLEVELDDATPDDVVLSELGRILRYWAGNLEHYPLTDGQRETISDSAYAEVGSWHVAQPHRPAGR